MRLVGRAQTTSRLWICIACSIEVVVPAVLAIPRKVESIDFSAPFIQKTDWRLAVNGPGLGTLPAACPSRFSRMPAPILRPIQEPCWRLTRRFRTARDLAVSRSV